MYFLIILLLILFIIVIESELWATYSVLFSISILKFFADHGFIPRPVILIPEIVFIFLLIKYILKKKRRKACIDSKILFLLLIYLFIGVLGIYFSGTNIMVYFWGIRKYFFYFFFFFIIDKLNPDETYYSKIFNIILFIAIFQIPFSVIESLIWGIGDWSGGSFGKNSAGVNALFLPIIYSVFLIKAQYNIKYLLVIPGFLLVLILGEIKAAFFLMLIISIIFIVKKNKKNIHFRSMIIILLIMPLIYIAINYYTYSWGGALIRVLESPQFILEREGGLKNFGTYYRYGRITSIIIAFQIINDNSLIFGFGLGNASVSFIKAWSGIMSNLNLWPSLGVYLLIESGLLGSLIFILILLRIFRLSSNNLFKFKNVFQESLSFSILVLVIIIFITFFYNPNVFLEIISFYLWFGVFYLSKIDRKSISIKGNINKIIIK